MNRKFKVAAAACSVQYMIVNVHTVSDVIISRGCGTFPAFVAIILLLALDCVMQMCIRLCLKAVVYFCLRS